MNDNIRTIIINKLLELIPSSRRPVDYLSEILDISKDSAYRRLKGKMSFHFEELVILSEELGFSLDEFVAMKAGNRKVVIDLNIDKDPERGFLEKMRMYKKDADNRLLDKSSSSMLALNYIPAELCVHHEKLFKFSYYIWLNWKSRSFQKLKYSELEISPELERLRKDIDISTRLIENNTFILDPNVFLSTLNMVHYFYDMGLINGEEKKDIKEEFQSILDSIEKKMRTEALDIEVKTFFYISILNLDVNSGYYVWNGNIASSFSLYFFNRIVISKPEICEAHKEWFLALKQNSILISGSNEAAQAAYLKKQRDYINLL